MKKTIALLILASLAFVSCKKEEKKKEAKKETKTLPAKKAAK